MDFDWDILFDFIIHFQYLNTIILVEWNLIENKILLILIVRSYY